MLPFEVLTQFFSFSHGKYVENRICNARCVGLTTVLLKFYGFCDVSPCQKTVSDVSGTLSPPSSGSFTSGL